MLHGKRLKNSKMSLINHRYNDVVCISLREREDKYRYMLNQFEKHNIKVEWYRPVVPGYAAKLSKPYGEKYNQWDKNLVYFNPQFPNELGAMQSHYHVIKTALLEGKESIFIFEDDCAFHKDWDTLLPKYLDTLPADADGILLYSYMGKLEDQNIRVKPRWTKGFASWSILAYGMNKKAMEAYINIQDQQPMIADRATWTMMTSFGYNFYIASPPLVIPTKSLTSNIRGEDKNYDKVPGQGGNIFMLGINENDYK
jgi:GR25 family glycosyltransferase involved in LPS biosynthesis